MTVLVIEHGITKTISTVTAAICPMRNIDQVTQRDCPRHKVNWMLAIQWKFSTLSVLDLGHVHHLPHSVLQEQIVIERQMEINEVQMLSVGFIEVEIIMLSYGVTCRLNIIGLHLIDLCLNLVPV
jgi:hypothetical protein